MQMSCGKTSGFAMSKDRRSSGEWDRRGTVRDRLRDGAGFVEVGGLMRPERRKDWEMLGSASVEIGLRTMYGELKRTVSSP